MQDQQIDPEVAAAAGDAEAKATAQIGAQAPKAAEPLDAGTLMDLHDAVANLVSTWTDGAHVLPPLQVQGPAEAIPPETFAPLLTTAKFLEAMGKPVLDPFQADTNQGIAELAIQIGELAADKALAEQVKSAGTGEQEAEETEDTDNMDDFVQ